MAIATIIIILGLKFVMAFWASKKTVFFLYYIISVFSEKHGASTPHQLYPRQIVKYP